MKDLKDDKTVTVTLSVREALALSKMHSDCAMHHSQQAAQHLEVAQRYAAAVEDADNG